MASGGTMRRRAMAIAIALWLLAPVAVHAQAPRDAVVYTFELTYNAQGCQGAEFGELRFTDTQVFMYGENNGSSQLVATGTVAADGTFSIDAPRVRLRLSGKRLPESVNGSGTFELFDHSCPFSISGERTGAPPAAPTSVPTVPVEEFDPTSTARLSDGEVAWLMRRLGSSQQGIDNVMNFARKFANQSRPDPRAQEALRYSMLVAALSRVRNPDDTNLYAFPILTAMVTRDGPFEILAPIVQSGSPDATATFNRLVRLAITAGL